MNLDLGVMFRILKQCTYSQYIVISGVVITETAAVPANNISEGTGGSMLH